MYGKATTVTVTETPASTSCAHGASSTALSSLSSTYHKSCTTAASSSAGIEALNSEAITPGASAGISGKVAALVND
jgi:hypothetical protein